MIKTAEIVDYNYQPERDSGKFLNLKEKNDKVVIRIATKPISYFVHWVNNKPVICLQKEECTLCKKVWPVDQIDQANREKRKQQFAWGVIDRKDGLAKIYKSGFFVFSEIGKYAKNPKYGDATLWDVEITRTEQSPSNFYSVVPDPDSRGKDLTKEELAEIEKLMPLLDATTTQTYEEVDSDKLPF